MKASRACDTCRRRKVKCDAAQPCSNCRISQLECGWTPSKGLRGPRVPKRRSTGPVLDGNSPQVVMAAGTEPRIDTDPITLNSSSTSAIVESWLDTPGGADLSRGEEISAISPCPVSSIASGSRRSSFLGADSTALVTHLSAVSDSDTHQDAEEIFSRLMTRIEMVLAVEVPTVRPDSLINSCIDLYQQYLFPNAPIAYLPKLRSAASIFLPGNDFLSLLATESDTEPALLHHLKNFTLITALCAYVMSVLPTSLVSQRALLIRPFLRASRAVLGLYEEYDLEYPDSTSLTIRIWQSIALQNTAGRTGAAWYHHSGATLLALRLRLFDEETINRAPLVESKLLRAIFWMLYVADKAAVIMETRVAFLNEPNFSGKLTVRDEGESNISLLHGSPQKIADNSLERRLAVGFRLKCRIWVAAADVLEVVKAYAQRKILRAENPELEQPDMMVASDANFRFMGLVHDLPLWLRNPDTVGAVADEMDAMQRKTCFWLQRANVMPTFHCLRLIIVQKCIEQDVIEVLGLNRQVLSWAIRKVEIVEDFLHELQTVPFLCLKAQGEATVERIRRVGSILLELCHDNNSQIIQDRAQAQFEQLLDILTRLDSKASDELRWDASRESIRKT